MRRIVGLGCLVWMLLPLSAFGQASGGPTISDSSVGYIDDAVPGTQVRMRVDSLYGANRPTRAEFFYAQGAPTGGPGLPKAETQVDFQEIRTYLEAALQPQFSFFLDMPVRFINPQINDNSAGYGDTDLGIKYAFVKSEERVVTFQLRTFVPTGDADRGLGTRHVSLEPGLLYYRTLGEHWTLEGELENWIPIGGTDFAGDVLIYGLGLSWGQRNSTGLRLRPVAEVVGWTALGGKEAGLSVPGGVPFVVGAAGDTIINGKFGARLGLGERADIYAGYGRAFTGDVWYKDIWRIEFRLLF